MLEALSRKAEHNVGIVSSSCTVLLRNIVNIETLVSIRKNIVDEWLALPISKS